MGAHPEDYDTHAPLHSFLHVDRFKTAKDLADYLKVLDNNDRLYNQYFKWKGTGEFINTKIMCRICALLHDGYYYNSGLRTTYKDLKNWWDQPGICTSTNWREDENHRSTADLSCGFLERLTGRRRK